MAISRWWMVCAVCSAARLSTPAPPEPLPHLYASANQLLNFFGAMISHLGLHGIQIQNFGGVSDLANFLETLAATAEFRDKAEDLGIIRDAERRPAQSAFQSVQGSLCRASLPVPKLMIQHFGVSPAVSVFILPDNESDGMLETLLCQTFGDTPVDYCIESFFECVSAETGEGLHRPDKARAHAFIATRRDPHVSVGVAAQRSYWDLDHVVFDGVRNFLRSL